jgi:hypothetical protein
MTMSDDELCLCDDPGGPCDFHVRMEREAELLPQAAKNICWMAEKIHQGYHTDHPGTWKTCTKGVCGSVEYMLAQAGFDKDLKRIEAVL